jgi:hypothetical protein
VAESATCGVETAHFHWICASRRGPTFDSQVVAEEAQDGQTKPDFIAKMAISRKESRESRYWLRVAIRLKKVTAEEVAWELKEAGELRAMIVAAIKTAQSSSSRGVPNPKLSTKP